MGFKFAVWALRVLETMFFAGLAGCAIVVVISWFSVGKGALTDKE
jgi:hypothetical protein